MSQSIDDSKSMHSKDIELPKIESEPDSPVSVGQSPTTPGRRVKPCSDTFNLDVQPPKKPSPQPERRKYTVTDKVMARSTKTRELISKRNSEMARKAREYDQLMKNGLPKSDIDKESIDSIITARLREFTSAIDSRVSSRLEEIKKEPSIPRSQEDSTPKRVIPDRFKHRW
jgi:hypothetical protein